MDLDGDSLHRELSNNIRRIDAHLSYYFHIPFPEELPDEVWIEKWRQIEWLSEKGLLGVKLPE